jgi:DNA polymerase (family X)
MPANDAQTVANLLREYAHRSSLRGANPYGTRAYLRAADSLLALSQPLDRVIAAGALTDIPGIGKSIADIVTKLHATGSHPSLEKFRKEVPAGVLELFAVPGLRPDKIMKLTKRLASAHSRSSKKLQKKTVFVRSKALALHCRPKSFKTLPSPAAEIRSCISQGRFSPRTRGSGRQA